MQSHFMCQESPIKLNTLFLIRDLIPISHDLITYSYQEKKKKKKQSTYVNVMPHNFWTKAKQHIVYFDIQIS